MWRRPAERRLVSTNVAAVAQRSRNASLIRRWRRAVRAAVVDRGAVRHQGLRLSRPAVVRQRAKARRHARNVGRRIPGDVTAGQLVLDQVVPQRIEVAVAVWINIACVV